MAHGGPRPSGIWPAFACAALLLLAGCSTAPATAPDIDGAFTIADGRELYLRCEGTGPTTVMLISGTGGASDEWTHVLDPADPSAEPAYSEDAVFGRVARQTRVCAYDRPGTTRFDGAPDPSTPIPPPRSRSPAPPRSMPRTCARCSRRGSLARTCWSGPPGAA